MPNPLNLSLLQKARQGLAGLFKTGFFSIFFSTVLIKIVGLVGNIILVRVLEKNDYGVYTYVMNAFAVLTLLADMGNGMTGIQLCSEYHQDTEKRDALFSMAFRRGMLISTLSALLVLCSGWFYPFTVEEAPLYTASLFLLPLIENVNRFLLNNAQIKLKNNIYAKINLFSSLIRYVVLLPLSYLFSFKGALYSEYVIALGVMVFAMLSSRSFLRLKAPEKCLTPALKKTFTKLSLSSALNNIINNSFSLIDVFLMGLIVKDLEVLASYKVAATIPLAMMFVPSAVDIYVMPHFARNRTNIAWVKKSFGILIGLLSAFNLLVCLGSIVLGPQIMGLLYGESYQSAATCFGILMVGYFFSAIRIVTYTVLYTQRQVNVIVGLTVVNLVGNFLLNMLLIPRFGSIGAALASAGIHLISAFLMILYLFYHLHRMGKQPQQTENE